MSCWPATSCGASPARTRSPPTTCSPITCRSVPRAAIRSRCSRASPPTWRSTPSRSPPPETLLPRLHRDLGSQRPRRRPITVFAVAASVVAVVGFAGLTVSQEMRVNTTQSRMDDIRRRSTSRGRPAPRWSQVDGNDSGTQPLTEISDPGVGDASTWWGTIYRSHARAWYIGCGCSPGTTTTFASGLRAGAGHDGRGARVRPQPVRPDPDLGRAGVGPRRTRRRSRSGRRRAEPTGRGRSDQPRFASRGVAIRVERAISAGPWPSRPPGSYRRGRAEEPPEHHGDADEQRDRRTARGRPAPRTRIRTRR